MDTFLVQVWIPADELSRGGDLRGLVRHVATGTETPFRGDEEILLLLHRAAGPGEGPRPGHAPGADADPVCYPHSAVGFRTDATEEAV